MNCSKMFECTVSIMQYYWPCELELKRVFSGPWWSWWAPLMPEVWHYPAVAPLIFLRSSVGRDMRSKPAPSVPSFGRFTFEFVSNPSQKWEHCKVQEPGHDAPHADWWSCFLLSHLQEEGIVHPFTSKSTSQCLEGRQSCSHKIR